MHNLALLNTRVVKCFRYELVYMHPLSILGIHGHVFKPLSTNEKCTRMPSLPLYDDYKNKDGITS